MGERIASSLPQYELKNRVARLLFGSLKTKTIYNLKPVEVTKPATLLRPEFPDYWEAWPHINLDELDDSMDQLQIIEPINLEHVRFQRPTEAPIPVSEPLIPMPPVREVSLQLPLKKQKSSFFWKK